MYRWTYFLRILIMHLVQTGYAVENCPMTQWQSATWPNVLLKWVKVLLHCCHEGLRPTCERPYCHRSACLAVNEKSYCIGPSRHVYNWVMLSARPFNWILSTALYVGCGLFFGTQYGTFVRWFTAHSRSWRCQNVCVRATYTSSIYNFLSMHNMKDWNWVDCASSPTRVQSELRGYGLCRNLVHTFSWTWSNCIAGRDVHKVWHKTCTGWGHIV